MEELEYAVNWGDLGEAIIALLFIAAITIAIETPIVLVGFRKSAYKHKFMILDMVTIFTNVILNAFISYFYFQIGYDIVFIELIIVLVEAVLYFLAIYDITKKRAFVVSFIANAVSFVAGTLIVEYSGLYDILINTTRQWLY